MDIHIHIRYTCLGQKCVCVCVSKLPDVYVYVYVYVHIKNACGYTMKVYVYVYTLYNVACQSPAAWLEETESRGLWGDGREYS